MPYRPALPLVFLLLLAAAPVLQAQPLRYHWVTVNEVLIWPPGADGAPLRVSRSDSSAMIRHGARTEAAWTGLLRFDSTLTDTASIWRAALDTLATRPDDPRARPRYPDVEVYVLDAPAPGTPMILALREDRLRVLNEPVPGFPLSDTLAWNHALGLLFNVEGVPPEDRPASLLETEALSQSGLPPGNARSAFYRIGDEVRWAWIERLPEAEWVERGRLRRRMPVPDAETSSREPGQAPSAGSLLLWRVLAGLGWGLLAVAALVRVRARGRDAHPPSARTHPDEPVLPQTNLPIPGVDFDSARNEEALATGQMILHAYESLPVAEGGPPWHPQPGESAEAWTGRLFETVLPRTEQLRGQAREQAAAVEALRREGEMLRREVEAQRTRVEEQRAQADEQRRGLEDEIQTTSARSAIHEERVRAIRGLKPLADRLQEGQRRFFDQVKNDAAAGALAFLIQHALVQLALSLTVGDASREAAMRANLATIARTLTSFRGQHNDGFAEALALLEEREAWSEQALDGLRRAAPGHRHHALFAAMLGLFHDQTRQDIPRYYYDVDVDRYYGFG